MSINKLKVEEKSGWIWSTTIRKDDQSLLFFSKLTTFHRQNIKHQTVYGHMYLFSYMICFLIQKEPVFLPTLNLKVLIYGREAPLYCSALFMDRSKSRPHTSHIQIQTWYKYNS